MALSRVRDEADWAEEIAESARETFDGELEIFKPGTPGKLDPITGIHAPGTPEEIILSRRPARAQHIRLPLDSNDGNGWQTRRRYRFQCDFLAGDLSVTKGLLVRFFGGRDPEVPKMLYQVQWATNSSSAAIRTVETLTEGARVG